MSNFWQELIISLSGNALLGGLIIYLGKIYLERIGRNEQATIDERLKNLEQDHEKRLTEGEHFHQISQQTYQKLFDRKIAVYDVLLSLTITFEKLTHPNFIKWDERTTESKIGHCILMSGLHAELSKVYSAIDENISKNITVLSSDLSEKFLIWLVHFRTEFDLYNKDNLDKILDTMGEAFLSQVTNNNEEIRSFLKKTDKNSYRDKLRLQNVKGSLLLKNLDQFNEILKQIKTDSLTLNKKINHIYL